MKRRLLIAVLAALAVTAAAVALWDPWDRCDAPEPVCTALGEIGELDNVLDTEVDYDAGSSAANGSGPVLVLWTFRLPETLSPQQAAELAARAAEQAQAVVVGNVELQHAVSIVAGIPQESQVPGMETYPLQLMLGDRPRQETAQAFSFWQQGATQVGNGSVSAPNTEALLELAQLARRLDYEPTLELPDGSIRYTPNGEFKLEQVQLAVEAAQQPNVANAIFGSGSLSVYSSAADDSEQTADIKRWLDAHEPLSEPTAYTLSSPDVGTIFDGWIGRELPDHLMAKPPVLPEGVTAWPGDANAPTCTQDDLKLSLSSPDAALGSRFLSLYAHNVSASACSLQGYAQITFLNADGDVQDDAVTRPETHVSAERIVVPSGEYAISTLNWKAMSTSQDPDETTDLSVAALPNLEPVVLTPMHQERPTSLDILDGARVDLGPWVQAAEGWSKPGESSGSGERPGSRAP
ncbi:DUF4232 domain-containing protein [Arthrobacter sp. LS16]|uniref:DUF4232 domain-containing protein n=2 Tax=Micrococcaceae TaxID=1268 RepID=A0A365YGQ3_9MICC|nr:DUF4232 domain-containing protein [Glutamicibacter soli]RBM01788.1 hypothetical protein C1H84_08075 [Glutamicibacter soli]